jgi:glycine cleavage system aminomethyltransferase T
MPGAQPFALSPAHQALSGLGALWSEREGWRTAASFGSPEQESQAAGNAAGLCDLSYLSKLECVGAELDRLLPARLGIDALPRSGSAVLTGATALYRFRRDQLLVCGTELARFDEDEGCVHIIDRTSGLACYLIAGPLSASILNRLTSLDVRDSRFPHLSCARSPLAHVNCWIVRRDIGPLPAFHIFTAREYGDYLFTTILDTGEPLGIRPMGLDALALLETTHA